MPQLGLFTKPPLEAYRGPTDAQVLARLVEMGKGPTGGPPRRPLLERFWEKVQRGDDDACWLWTASVDAAGYGQFGISSGNMLGAHRMSWCIHHEAVPTNLDVLHRCDVPACVNPRHLFLGTQADNNLDRDRKGRQALGEENGKTVISEAQAREIKTLLVRGIKPKEIVDLLGVEKHTVIDISRGKSWRHVLVEYNRSYRVGTKLILQTEPPTPATLVGKVDDDWAIMFLSSSIHETEVCRIADARLQEAIEQGLLVVL